MAKISKKTARNVGQGLNPTAGTGPLAGPDYDKLFKEVADTPPTSNPLDTAAEAKKKKEKMKKSIFNT